MSRELCSRKKKFTWNPWTGDMILYPSMEGEVVNVIRKMKIPKTGY
jgi:hypothetical protein